MSAFERLFYPLVDKHAPMKKWKNVRAPWIVNFHELKNIMFERDVAKGTANRTGNKEDWDIYCKLRNQVNQLKLKGKRKECFTKLK